MANSEREENRSNDAESTATPGDTSNRGRGSFDRGRGRGRGGKRPKEFIQQAGVFSQGLAPSMKPSWGNKNHDSSASTGISKPKLKLNVSIQLAGNITPYSCLETLYQSWYSVSTVVITVWWHAWPESSGQVCRSLEEPWPKVYHVMTYYRS